MNITYLKVTIKTTTQGAEAVAPILERLGVTSYSIEDPADLDYATGSAAGAVWDFIDPSLEVLRDSDVLVSFYLPEDDKESVGIVEAALKELLEDAREGVYGEDADFGKMTVESKLICDDWVARSKAAFHTFSPIKGVVIRPPWEDSSNDGDEVVIVIDPGMAFGTGSHETTSMCLACLSKVFTDSKAMSILDVGTGSGILAIYAALRGVKKVTAVEIDEDAAASAAGNIAGNDVKNQVELVIGDACLPGILKENEVYDVILANLTMKILTSILPNLKGRLAPDGVFILSGLLDVQEEQIYDFLIYEGLKIKEIVRQGEWIAVVVG